MTVRFPFVSCSPVHPPCWGVSPPALQAPAGWSQAKTPTLLATKFTLTVWPPCTIPVLTFSPGITNLVWAVVFVFKHQGNVLSLV